MIKNKGEDKTPHGMILAVISALCLAELLIVEQELKNRILLVLFGCCVLAVVLLIFYLYDVLISAYKKLEEQSLMEKQMLIYSHQLDVLMQSEEKVKALRHDMKNHLGELALMAANQNNEEIRKYIQDMGEYMQNQSELVSCGNKNLDSLLNYLLGQAKKKLNHVEYEVRVPSDLCISAFDLNVILGNLTENAIEAAEQTKDKWMSVDIYYEKGMLSMEIKNSFQHELAVEKNKLLSTKEEKGHGIGLANVRKMVEKYQGFMDVSNTNQIFTVKVMLYL
ncbi:sensor histidine kinase [Blautia sp. HCN-1074]|uniref:sensor histidine kinase n=1 Tax=Blautia sp. HCN-1074 TaxID=3134667 RepID=UPI0015FB55CC